MKQPIEFRTALLILFAVAIVAGGLVIYKFQKISESPVGVSILNPNTTNSITAYVPTGTQQNLNSAAPIFPSSAIEPSATIDGTTYPIFADDTSSTIWQTYTDLTYGFSIKFPCNNNCRTNITGSDQNKIASGDHAISLPTIDPRTAVQVRGFTDEESGQNNTTTGMGTALYSFSKIKAALELPEGAQCDIYEPSAVPATYISTEPCSIVILAGQKAVQFLAPPGFGNVNYSDIIYFISRGTNRWLEINESFVNKGVLTVSPTTTDSQIQPQIIAAKQVLNTLQLENMSSN